MAYQVKTIRYQNTSRKILLQNINGPCPLLAAANALLLRGVISLSGECVRSGVASTDDVVNMLAGWAIERSGHREIQNVNNTEQSTHEYHLNEVLSLLPSLQHGMDVNPKFTSPTAVEYTNNLAVFDSLGIELVHGWIMDPTEEAAIVIGAKSYNELIELVIAGSDANDEIGRMNILLRELENKLNHRSKEQGRSGADNEAQLEQKGLINTVYECEASVSNNVSSDKTNNKDEANEQYANEDTHEANIDSAFSDTAQSEDDVIKVKDGSSANGTLDPSENSPHEIISTTDTAKVEKSKVELEWQISKLRQNICAKTHLISKAETINGFLTTSSHQLTYHGLEQLHKHLCEDDLAVFFRNNHFATLTKHDNTLYLLVTDLGYANNQEIVWEKLDAIDGDTEYTNEVFCRPKVPEDLTPAAGPSINPELLLAQRSQAESDYALALALSEGRATSETMDEDESTLIAAATHASLNSYHEENDTASAADEDTQIDADREVALAFQREQEKIDYESEQLARQLQQMEYAQRKQPVRRAPPARTGRPPQQANSTSSNCVVS